MSRSWKPRRPKWLEVEEALDNERRYWQEKEKESEQAIEAALAEAQRDYGTEAKKRRDLAKETRRLEEALEAIQARAERLEELEAENEGLRLAAANAVPAENPALGDGSGLRPTAMAAAVALLVGAGGAWWLMPQSSGDETERLMAELEETRTQLAAAQATIEGIGQQTAAGSEDEDAGGWQPFETFRDCEDVCPTMVAIPSGTFIMGSPEDEAGRSDDEGPQHEVTIAEPFALCETEVTFAQWDACVADGGCDHEPGDQGWGRGNRPVIDVSWDDTQQYLAWLSANTGRTYRLPSEADWEYTARTGTTTPFSTGEMIGTDDANYNGNYPYAGGEKGAYREKTLSVGSLTPNPFGLFDMHGNVWEWVEDRYHNSYQGAPSDGTAWLEGGNTARVVRGGSWVDDARDVRSAYRFAYEPGARGSNLGFRCAGDQS